MRRFYWHVSFEDAEAEARYGFVRNLDLPVSELPSRREEAAIEAVKSMHYACYRAANAPLPSQFNAWEALAVEFRNAIVLQYQGMIRKVANKSQCRHDGCEGRCQSLSLHLLYVITGFNPWLDKSLSTYIHVSMNQKNAIIDRAWSIRTCKDHPFFTWFDTPAKKPEEPIDTSFLSAYLQRGQAILTDRQLEVLEHLFGLNGRRECTVGETSQVLDISRSAVNMHKLNALRLIWDDLRNKGLVPDRENACTRKTFATWAEWYADRRRRKRLGA